MKFAIKTRGPAYGFSLLETMVAVAVLLILVIGVFRQVQRAQASYRVEDQKLDVTQQQREFIDMFTRDLHQAGYPSPNSFNINALGDNRISAGLVSINNNSLTIEGDLDGTGVQTITYAYNAGGGCPGGVACILRTSGPKGAAGVTTAVVQNVVAPPAAGIFTAYKADGKTAALPLGPPAAGATTGDATYLQLRGIKSVRVTLTLAGLGREMNGANAIQVNMTGTARIPNN